MASEGRRQNVTLVLPHEVLVTAKHMAVDDDTTLSDLVARLVEEESERRQHRHRALLRVRERIARGYDLGTGGRVGVTREELHER